MNWYAFFENRPLIPSVVTCEVLPAATGNNVGAVLITKGTIFNIADMVREIKKRGKLVFVHIDLVDGIGKDRVAIEFLHRELDVDGIATPNSTLIQFAKKEGLYTIQRVFAHDSPALEKGIEIARTTKPDLVSVLPGLILPYISKKLLSEIKQPIVAAGLIKTREQVEKILASGALAINTSEQTLWAEQKSNHPKEMRAGLS